MLSGPVWRLLPETLPPTAFLWASHNVLAEDPLLFAAGGQDNRFQVIYARLHSDKLLLGLERPVVTTLLRSHPYGLFTVSNDSQQLWHLINVRDDRDLEKRRLFHRLAPLTSSRGCEMIHVWPVSR